MARLMKIFGDQLQGATARITEVAIFVPCTTICTCNKRLREVAFSYHSCRGYPLGLHKIVFSSVALSGPRGTGG